MILLYLINDTPLSSPSPYTTFGYSSPRTFATQDHLGDNLTQTVYNRLNKIYPRDEIHIISLGVGKNNAQFSFDNIFPMHLDQQLQYRHARSHQEMSYVLML